MKSNELSALHFLTGRLFAQNENLEMLVAESWFHFYVAWRDWATHITNETKTKPKFHIENRDCGHLGHKISQPCLCLSAGIFNIAMVAFPDSWIDEVKSAFDCRLETLYEMGWEIEHKRKAA